MARLASLFLRSILQSQRVLKVSAIGVVLAVLAGFSAPLAGQTRLSYLVETSGKVEWRLFDAVAGKTRLLASLDSMPRRFFFARDGMTAFVALEEGIYRLSLAEEQPELEQVTPAVPDRFPEIIWLEETSGKLRALAMTAVAEEALRAGTDGELYIERDDGEIITGFADPPWGMPYLAEVMEYEDGDGWQNVARLASRWDAEDTPGLSVADDFRNEVGLSGETFARQALCKQEDCAPALPGKLEEAARSLYGDDPYAEEIRYLPPADGVGGVVFALAFGDSWHAFAPLYFLAESGADLQQMDLNSLHQVMLSQKGRYLLVAEEYSGANPHIVDLTDGKTIFREGATRAIWLPE